MQFYADDSTNTLTYSSDRHTSSVYQLNRSTPKDTLIHVLYFVILPVLASTCAVWSTTSIPCIPLIVFIASLTAICTASCHPFSEVPIISTILATDATVGTSSLSVPKASTRSLAVTIATGLPSSVRGNLFMLLDAIILAASLARIPIGAVINGVEE